MDKERAKQLLPVHRVRRPVAPGRTAILVEALDQHESLDRIPLRIQPVDFEAIDGQPVHTLFSMVSPTIRGHLGLLAKLSRALHDPAFKAVVLRRGSLDELAREAERVEATFPRVGAAVKR